MELIEMDRWDLQEHIMELERLLVAIISEYKFDLKMLGCLTPDCIEEAEKYLTSATCNTPKPVI